MSNRLADKSLERLSPWQEASGRLERIEQYDHCTILEFRDRKVLLNSAEAASIEDQLNENLIGQWISILKTDLPDRLLLLRTSSSQTAAEEASDPLRMAGGL